MWGVTLFPTPHHAPVFIDRSPSLVALVESGDLSGMAASALVGVARVRTLGAACRLGYRELRRIPGLGPKGLASLLKAAAELGLEVEP